MPKVSIAVLTYNRREYLKECIKSILNQTFQDFLIYIFDNCSDYDIVKFLERFNDKRIILLRGESNLGEQKNYERVFNYKFPSEYTIIFHDDDTMHPLLIEKEVNLISKYQDMVWVGSELNFVKNHRKMFDFKKMKNKENFYIFSDPADLIRLLLSDFDLCYDSVIFRQNALNILADITKTFYFNRFFKWSDRPYLIELAKNGKVGVIKEKLVNYRIHKEQDSQSESLDKNDYALNLLLFYKENLPQPLSKKDKKLFYSFSTNNLILAGFSFSRNWQEYKKFLEQAKNKNFFRLKYLNFRGVYYFFKGIRKFYFQKNKIYRKFKI